MSEKGGGGGGGGGLDGLLLWENCQPWVALMSDNSGGSTDQEMGLGMKPPLPRPPSSSNNPLGAVPMGSTDQADAAVLEEPSKKRGRGGGGGGGGDEKGSGGEVKEGKGGESADHDQMHIWTERERRKKMRDMFANLHALLPQLPPKIDKSTIVDEAVNHIKTLQQTLQKLQKQKLERLQGLASATIGVGSSSSTAAKKLELNSSREAFLADHHGASGNSGAVEATNIVNSSSNAVLAPGHPVGFQTWTSSNVVLNICGDEAQFSVCSLKKPGLFSTICHVLEKHEIDVVYAQASSDSTCRMFMIQAKVNNASDQSSAANIPVQGIYKHAASELMTMLLSP